MYSDASVKQSLESNEIWRDASVKQSLESNEIWRDASVKQNLQPNYIWRDPLEDFRYNFYQKLEDEKIKKEREIKLQQKNCWHKYTRFIKYNEKITITVCEKCNHAKWC